MMSWVKTRDHMKVTITKLDRSLKVSGILMIILGLMAIAFSIIGIIIGQWMICMIGAMYGAFFLITTGTNMIKMFNQSTLEGLEQTTTITFNHPEDKKYLIADLDEEIGKCIK